jgi:hypothetical protein
MSLRSRFLRVLAAEALLLAPLRAVARNPLRALLSPAEALGLWCGGEAGLAKIAALPIPAVSRLRGPGHGLNDSATARLHTQQGGAAPNSDPDPNPAWLLRRHKAEPRPRGPTGGWRAARLRSLSRPWLGAVGRALGVLRCLSGVVSP